MDFSIIVPCHNLESYIKNLLLSFHMLDLSKVSYEIIFILDSCTDKTEDIIHSYMEDMNYKIITCFAGSPGLARNHGIKLANGDYIWFVDGDDWIINPLVLLQAKTAFEKTKDIMIQIEFVSNYFKMQHYSMVWQYMFTKDFLQNFKFNDKQNFEDNDFMKDVLEFYFDKYKKTEITYLSIPSYYYNYLRPDSQTTKLREK